MRSLQRMNAEAWRNMVGADAKCVLEVGCHDGSDTLMLLEAFPKAELHCWEPDDRPVGRFRKNVGDNTRVTLNREAVCDVEGKAPWYSSHGEMPNTETSRALPEAMRKDWDASGSIMCPTGHLVVPNWLRFQKDGCVNTTRLDTWLGLHPEITGIDLIWADIQGAELRMIVGGADALRITRYLYAEIYDNEIYPTHKEARRLYAGQPFYKDFVEALPGWKLLGLYNEDSLLFRNEYAEYR